MSLPPYILTEDDVNSELLKEVQQYVRQLLEEQLPKGYVYHNIHHTEDIVQAVLYIGKGNKLPAPALAVVEIAAWFHDVGYIFGAENHEQNGCRLARRFLEQQGVKPEVVSLIEGCILATHVPQKPQNLMEAVLADADLCNLSTSGFTQNGNLLRQEWELFQHKVYTEKEWVGHSLQFLLSHHYHTSFAIKTFEQGKKRNIRALKAKYMALAVG